MRRSYAGATALIVTMTLTLAACGSTGTTPTGASSTTSGQDATAASSPTDTGTPSGTGTPAETAQGPASPGATSPGAASTLPTTFAYVPLWPFASVAEAVKWQREALPGGHQPGRLDAGVTAVAFAQQYLKFAEIDRVVRQTVTANEARVTVGYKAGSESGTAAVIHLVRIGTGAGAGRPWEVVGTDDKANFTVTKPRYGSKVKGGTITVGGHIVGVDESIRVTARQLTGVVGNSCCLPAGASAPWSVRLNLTRTRPGPMTIVASTGGHLTAVERFAVTGALSAP